MKANLLYLKKHPLIYITALILTLPMMSCYYGGGINNLDEEVITIIQ